MSLSSGGGKVLRSTSISIGSLGGSNGGLNLTDNAMIVDYTGASPLASISSLIKNGTYNSGTGTFSGIISSTAITNVSSHKTGLGYGEASALGVSSFQGQSVDSTSILIRYTYLGDANRYMEVFKANADQLSNPDQIKVGQKLKIPTK